MTSPLFYYQRCQWHFGPTPDDKPLTSGHLGHNGGSRWKARPEHPRPAALSTQLCHISAHKVGGRLGGGGACLWPQTIGGISGGWLGGGRHQERSLQTTVITSSSASALGLPRGTTLHLHCHIPSPHSLLKSSHLLHHCQVELRERI